MCLITWSAIAAEGAAMDDGTEMVDESSAKTAMMRRTSPVQGYQALSVAGQNIDSAYLEETIGERHGVVVFFHDQGESFESNGVVTPLRHRLIDYGWSTLTLSFDMPFNTNVMLSASLDAKSEAGVEENETKNDDEAQVESEVDFAAENDDTEKNDLPPVPNLERVEAALAMLQAKGFERVIFLGHGKGAEMAIDMMQSQTLPIEGLVLVNLPKIEITDDFKGIGIPVLEVYASQGLPGVEMAVKQRKAAMKREAKTNYAVRRVLGANHVFYGLEPMLLMTVKSWLNASFVKPGL